MNQAFTQGEPNLVNDPIDNSSDLFLSLPETLSLPSTLSKSQTSIKKSDDIHKDIQEHNIQILTHDNLTLKFEITVKLNN